MYRACSINLLFENNPKQSIEIAYGGTPDMIGMSCNEEPDDPYAGAYLTFNVDEFRDFIAACQEALDKKLAG